MAGTTRKKYNYFIGIDVSKNQLDYAVMRGSELLFHREGKNEAADILAFIKGLKTLPGFTLRRSVFCMEHTGYYCNHLVAVLKKVKGNAVLDNPMHIKYSMGLVRGKNDRADATRIAAYAQKNGDELKLWVTKRIGLVQLAGMLTLRKRLSVILQALETPLEDQEAYLETDQQQLLAGLCTAGIAGIRTGLEQVELAMEQVIRADQRLSRLRQVITSVPGVGPVTALQLIVSTNEFLTISCPRKFACYAGVAPFNNESGQAIKRQKISHVANKKVKTLLHLCALNVSRNNPYFRAYFERKTIHEHKPRLLVLNAIRNKLLHLVFACVNRDQLYRADYAREALAAGETV